MSSTFSDLKEERNALQREVFPKLRELCMEHGFRFQAIDLRWGVSEEAGLDQQTMKICLEEIERSQRVSPKPNFIVLLGNRYGWRPLPYEIPADEFEEILDKVSEKDKTFLSWKGDLLDDEQLKKREGWYCLDTNTMPPVYCLKPRFVDYAENDSDEEIKAAKDLESKDWGKIEERIKTLLLNAIELEWPENDPRRSKYEDSATEQEIMKGVLEPPKDIPHPEEHVFCFFREIEDKGSINYNEYSENFLDFDESKKIDELSAKKLELLKEEIRKKLPEKNIISYQTFWNGNSVKTNHLDDLCRDVYLSLACTIMKQIEEYEEKDPLDLEIEAHKEFGKERCKFFIGREENRDKIKDYLKTPNHKPMIVYGESGSGKSALMAKAIEDSSPDFYGIKEDDELYNDGFIARFIGATPESSDLRSLLESLSRQITKIYGEDDSNIPSEYNELVQDFKERLNFATAEKPIIIFLDALDQLSDSENTHNLTWIPDELPENVNIILSTLKEPFQSYIENRLLDDNSDEVLKLVEGKLLLESWLNNAGRILTDEQKNQVIGKFEVEGLPLYLKLAFEEAKRWKSYTPLPNLKSDIFGIINFMFERLSRPENHGKILVSKSLGYLSAAKNGLTEDEMLDILALDKEVFSLTKKFHSPPEEKLPVAVWSRLYFDLEPYLTERSADETSLMAFYHRQLGEVAQEEYLTKIVKKERHKHLAEYFYKQELFYYKEGKKNFNIRKVSELPYQEIHGKCWKHLEGTLCDLRFIDAKCVVGRTYELIEDYNLALDMLPEAQEGKEKKIAYEQRVEKYKQDLIAYAKREIQELEIIPSVKPWSPEEIKKNNERIIKNPTRLNRIKSFSQFVNSQSHLLVEFGSIHGFCFQQAYNSANSGPVATAAEDILNSGSNNVIVSLRKSTRPEYKPESALIKTLKGHSANAIDITPDGKKVVSGGNDGDIKIWDSKMGYLLKTENFHSIVNDVCFALDGRSLLAGLNNGIKLWNLENFKQFKSFEHSSYDGDSFKDFVSKVDITPNGKIAISGGPNRILNVWDLSSEERLKILEGEHTDQINSVFIAPRGKLAVSGGNDASLIVWDLKNNKNHHLYVKGLNGFGVTPDCKLAVSGGTDGKLRVWDLYTMKCLKTLETNTVIYRVCITADGKLAVSGCFDGILQIWDLENGKCLKTLKTTLDINNLSITPDGKKAVTANRPNVLMVWDLERGSENENVESTTNGIYCLDTTPNGEKTILACRQNIQIWDRKTYKCLEILDCKSPFQIDITPDGKKAIFFIKQLIVCDLERGLLSPYKGDLTSYISSNFCMTPDGKIALREKSREIEIWEIEKGKLIKTLKGHADSSSSAENISALSVTPDGKKLISATNGVYDKTIRIWDIKKGKMLKILKGNSVSSQNSMVVTPDGKKLVAASDNINGINVFNLETGECLNTIESYACQSHQHVMAVTPDGKKIVSSSGSGGIDIGVYVWDLEKGECIYTLAGHQHWVNNMSITPDGKKVLIGSADGTLRLWDLENGNLIAIYDCVQSISSISKIRPNGEFLCGTNQYGPIFLKTPSSFLKTPIITPIRLWLYEKSGYWDENITANCQYCGNHFNVEEEILYIIREIENQYIKPNGWISDEAWDEPGLISECPECHEKLKFNPFIVDNKPHKSRWKFWK